MVLSVSRGARALVPLAVAFALLIGAALVPVFLVVEQERAGEATAKAVAARSELLQLFSAVQDAETGQRGYLLRGEDTYLAPYRLAMEQIDARFLRLEHAYAEDERAAGMLAHLKQVVADKLAELRRTVDLKAAGQDRAAIDVVKDDRGLRLMNEARELIAELTDMSQRSIDASRARLRTFGRLVEAALVFAIVAAIAAAGFVLLDTRRRELRLEAAVVELEATNQALSDAIARRQQVEGQLRHVQKMEAIGQLTGGIAHDFNNMLAVILSSLSMIKRKVERGEWDFATYVNLGIDGAQRAAALTNRLLSFARRQPLAPEVLALNKMLPSLSEMLRRTLGEAIQFETVLAGGLWYARADAGQLENAIVNLAVNARDAMPDGGRLTIETANAHLDEAYAAQHVEVKAGQYVMVAVSDSGAGMPPDVLSKAFDPFFTTKDVGQGTGLGLSQVYGFVKQSGGHIKIYSEPGAGTTVKIYLPRCLEAPLQIVSGARPVDPSIPSGKPNQIILVVEDEDSVRRLAVDSLRDLNYTVIHTGSGFEALKVFERGQEVTLLLTDVVMPQINGKQLVDKARALRPDLKALYMTGYTRNAIVHNGVIDHGVQLISKPFTLEQLAAKVHECIGGG